MKLQPGMRVAFTAAHCKATRASPARANQRGTYRGLDTIPGYCRVTWDGGPAAPYDADPEYVAMSRDLGELCPLSIICGVKSAQFIDTYAKAP